jgi:hypothetical protein
MGESLGTLMSGNTHSANPRKLDLITESCQCDDPYNHFRPQVGRRSFDPEFPEFAMRAVLGRARVSVNTVER